MFKAVIKILLFLLIVAIITLSLSFSSNKLSGVKCEEVKVVIHKDSPRFMDEEEIAAIVTKNNLLNMQMDSINTEKLEEQLKEATAIKNAEIFRHIDADGLNFKGRLVVEVEQREPLFRVISGTKDFYMDKEGVSISGNQKYSAHVLLVTGSVDEEFARESLLPLITFIKSNDFWEAQIKQIYVEDNKELILTPLIGDQRIEFGKPEDFQIKFRNLKALYEQEFPEIGWNYYKTINLKYNNQVVCTKK